MNLEPFLKEKGEPFWIPGASRKDLPELFKSLGMKKGVEVGVSWGQNIVDYCKAGLDISGVDPWSDTRDEKFRKIISIEGKYGNSREGVYTLAKKRTQGYPNCHLIRKTSMEALDDFPKRSLDFVYIDASHEFGYVAMDLMQWTDKVRKGGIIAGHDYYSTQGNRGLRQVQYVVDCFIKSDDIANWWVLGTKDNFVDREFSFFFFKHW